ncbi:MAG: hypothetical protein ABSF64_32320 [Bryobacteraceae bacterium]
MKSAIGRCAALARKFFPAKLFPALLFGADLLLGHPTAPAPKTTTIPDRVAAIRRTLPAAKSDSASVSETPRQKPDALVKIAQWINWGNWNNWNNWANWSNWANWVNWRNI